MKVSLNWVKEYVDVDLSVDQLVEKIGAQLGAVEEVVDLASKYKGILIAKVVSCVSHPNADKLHVCKIDDGGKAKGVRRDADGHVQVVCGAPDVREGLLVAWLPPGVTVPSTAGKDPLVLEAREIRGSTSNGMLASPAELAISDSHDGILEITGDYKPGDDFAAAVGLDDQIIDIENKMFTHRPDCFGQLGVAREIAGITGQAFKSPKEYLEEPVGQTAGRLDVAVKNEITDLVPRFLVRVIENVSVKPSPIWLQSALARVGIRPINNIVDLTNYFMALTAQPLHAYDYDKVKALSQNGAALTVRAPKKGEKLALLNGKTIDLQTGDIVIATDKQAIGLGGIMGGAETEVDNNTQNIILECANFDMYATRRSSMEHGLFTDAVTRFNKGQSPWQCGRVLNWASAFVQKLADGQPGNSYDLKGKLPKLPTIHVEAEFINDRLGSDLTAKQMTKLLSNVEFEAYADGSKLTIAPPFWRTDIEIPEDIVEEIGRLHGYDQLPVELPVRSISPAPRDALLDFKAQVRQALAAAGANEVLTYSFVDGNLFDKTGQNRDEAYELSNALSPDLQYFRQSLMPSLLDKVYPNVRAGHDEFVLFEINKAHNVPYTKQTGDKLPSEMPLLGLVYVGAKTDIAGAAYYQARQYLQALCQRFGLKPTFAAIDKDPGFPITAPYDYKRSAMVTDANTGTYLGIIGEFKRSVSRQLKLPAMTAGFELGLEDLMKAAGAQQPYTALPRFPSVQQDMTLHVPADVSFQSLHDLVAAELEKSKPANSIADLSCVDIYQPEDAKTKNVTFRLKIASYERTLKAEEVNLLLDSVANQAKTVLGASRV